MAESKFPAFAFVVRCYFGCIMDYYERSVGCIRLAMDSVLFLSFLYLRDTLLYLCSIAWSLAGFMYIHCSDTGSVHEFLLFCMVPGLHSSEN